MKFYCIVHWPLLYTVQYKTTALSNCRRHYMPATHYVVFVQPLKMSQLVSTFLSPFVDLGLMAVCEIPFLLIWNLRTLTLPQNVTSQHTFYRLHFVLVPNNLVCSILNHYIKVHKFVDNLLFKMYCTVIL